MINPITFQNMNVGSAVQGVWQGNASKSLLTSILIVVLLWLIYLVVRLFINKRCKNLKKRTSWRTRAFYTILFLSFYFLGRIWFDGLQNLFTFLSIIAAALTITQKESLMNLIGCALIYWRELFHTGDRIQIGNYYGEVTAIRTFYFHMLECDSKKSGDETTGKIIKIPNSLVITTPITNFSELSPFIWQEFSLILTPTSNLETAREVLMELIDAEVKHYYLESKHYLKKFVRDNFISEQQLRTQSFIRVHPHDPGGFEVLIRYLCLPAQANELESRVLEKFLEYIKISKIAELAFD